MFVLGAGVFSQCNACSGSNPVIYSTWIVFVRRCALKTRQVSVTFHTELPVSQLSAAQVKAVDGISPGFPNDMPAASQPPQRLLLEVDCYQTRIFKSPFPVITLRMTL